MIEFSKEQLDYINAPLTKNVYLRACPGSGKTEVIAAKVAKEVRNWSRFPAGIVVLSFSRSATGELVERIAQSRRGTRSTFPHFVGTVDSFFLKQIVNPLAHRLTGYQGRDGDFTIRVVDEHAVCFHRTKYKIGHEHIPANRYDWDYSRARFVFRHPIQAKQRSMMALQLEKYQLQDLAAAKSAFNAKGFATHKDVERIAHEILSRSDFDAHVELIVARFPHIIIDECQDLSADQIAIFTKLANRGVTFHLIGDLDQAIYLFRNCKPEDVTEFVSQLQCEEMPLRQNFRSGQRIVDLHGALVKAEKIDGRANYAAATCYLVEYQDCPSEALQTFDGLAVGHERAVIVARGHSTLQKMRVDENVQGSVQLLAAAIATYARGGPGDLNGALSLFARYLSEDCIKQDSHSDDVFCRPVAMESALDWHRFLSDCLSAFESSGLAEQSVTWSTWCALHKKTLVNLAGVACPDVACEAVLKALMERHHRAPSGQSGSPVAAGIAVGNLRAVRRRLATIHEVKGETHDVTMLVSSGKQGEQAHWKEWLANPTSEAARFAYVASSRPRHILIWAVRKLKDKERTELMSLGFQKSL